MCWSCCRPGAPAGCSLRRSCGDPAAGRCCCRGSSRSASSTPTRCCSKAAWSWRCRPRSRRLRRQWLLARLFERSGWRATHALRLADELAALLDELQTERVPLDALARLVPDHLAEHWQKNQAVLAVIAEAWPQVLAAEGALDPAERRHRLLTELAARWRAAPPGAKGGRGRLHRQHSGDPRPARQPSPRLPRGTVVLPGLDQAMDEASWRSLDPSHPQYGLKQLLEALGVERAAVGAWLGPGRGRNAARAGAAAR